MDSGASAAWPDVCWSGSRHRPSWDVRDDLGLVQPADPLSLGRPGYLMLFSLLGDAIARRSGSRVGAPACWPVRRPLVLASMAAIADPDPVRLAGQQPVGRHARRIQQRRGWTGRRFGDDLRARGLLPPGTGGGAFNWRDAGKIGYALGSRRDNAVPEIRLASVRLRRSAARFHEGQNVLLLLVDPAERASEQAIAWFRTVDTLPPSFVRFAACCEPSRSSVAMRYSRDHEGPEATCAHWVFHYAAEFGL